MINDQRSPSALQQPCFFKRAKLWEARDDFDERRAIYVGLPDGSDLIVGAEYEVFDEAAELEPWTPIRLWLEIETTGYDGKWARLRATKIKIDE